MKTKISPLIISLTLMSCNTIRDTQIIRYDFSKGEIIGNPARPKQGNPIIFKIDSINNLFYKVEISPQDIAVKDENLFDVPQPPKEGNDVKPLSNQVSLNASSNVIAEVQNVKTLGSASNIGNQEFQKVVAHLQEEMLEKIRNKNTKIEQQQFLKKAKAEIEINLYNLNVMEKQLREDLSKKNESSLESQSSKLEETIDQKKAKEVEKLKIERETNVVEKEIEKYGSETDQIKSHIEKLSSANKTVKDLIITYYDFIKKNYSNLHNTAEDIYRMNENYNNYIDKIYRPELTKGEYEKIQRQERLENCVVLNREKLTNFYKVLNSFDETKSKLLVDMNDIMLYKIKNEILNLPNGAVMIEEFSRDIVEIKKDIDFLSKNISDLNMRKKLNYVEMLDRVLSNENTYSYTSIPIQGFEDYLKFDVLITERTKVEEGKYIINKSKKFEYKEYLRGGVRFDFSLGTVFDIGNKQQEFDVIQDISGYKIIKKTNNQYIPTIAGMLHTSWRSANNFSFAFSLGVSMDMTQLQLNSLFPGASLMIGKTDKIIFTAGPALRKITELHNGFTLNQPMTFSPQDYTTESYKLGWFVGVSWNLTSKQKSVMRMSY